MSGPFAIFVAVILALGLGACAHPQARTQPEVPPLEVPVPPARTITPPPPDEPPPVTTVQPPDATGQKPVRPRPSQAKADPPPSLPPAAPPPAQPQATPPAQSKLQTTPPASQGELVRNIRDLLTRAQRDLKGIDRNALNADGKAQFDTALRFAVQAEQALKDMNLVFALTLADKAATLARSLSGR